MPHRKYSKGEADVAEDWTLKTNKGTFSRVHQPDIVKEGLRTDGHVEGRD